MIIQQFQQEGNSFFFHHSVSQIPSDGLTIGPESHSQYELLSLIRGDLTYRIEGREYAVSPGDMILIAPNDIHTLRIAPGAVYERMVLHFNLELIRKAFRELQLEWDDFTWSRSFPVIPGPLCQEYGLTALLQELMGARQPEAYQGMYTAAKTLELLIDLDKLFSHRGQRLPAPVSVDPLIQSAVAFIHAHLREPFSLDAMAQALYVSKSTLCHRFRQTMNITLNRYAAVKKIHLADELIRKGMPATEACQQVGYGSYTTFYYNYRQLMGCKPSQGK